MNVVRASRYNKLGRLKEAETNNRDGVLAVARSLN